jgi:hypothetical protein
MRAPDGGLAEHALTAVGALAGRVAGQLVGAAGGYVVGDAGGSSLRCSW